MLWFEISNRYIVISEPMLFLLESFLKVDNQTDFIEHTARTLNLTASNAEVYYSELNELLHSLNTTPELDRVEQDSIKMVSETGKINAFYSFGSIVINVRYNALPLHNLIHPQWAHASVLAVESPSATVNLFQKDAFIYLYIHNNYIGHYPILEYHLLQGQCSLQLINILYKKTEADWIATFHASTVCNGKEAIMLIGASGNGKSTLAAVLMAHGFDVLADDYTPLSAENRELYRYPSGISVKEGAFPALRTLYPDFESYPLYESSSKHVGIKYIPPIKAMDEARSHFPCKTIVYVNYQPRATSELKKIGTAKILETLIPESWLSPLATNAELFLEWLKDLNCYELTYSNNDVAVSKFSELFKELIP